MSNALVYPIIVPFVTASVSLLFWRRPAVQQMVSLAGAATHLTVCSLLLWQIMHGGIQVLYLGSWPAPYGAKRTRSAGLC